MEPRQIFAHFDGSGLEASLIDLCFDLLAEQTESWPQLRKGYQALDATESRDIPCAGFIMKVQWNPQRIVSSAAKLDAASIQARPCFLCAANLPGAQRAILYRRSFVVLCNPAPIFKPHFTIAHVQHRPQAIESELVAFLSLIRDLSPHFMVYYNGPQSGASAPDHFHFQAAPAGALPVAMDIQERGTSIPIDGRKDAGLFSVNGLGRAILLVGGASEETVASMLAAAVAAIRKVMRAPGEPMMNLIGSYEQGRWTILIFPRTRHRPSCYDLEGDRQVLITPAAVEMGGLFVTPKENDFRAVDAGLIGQIFREVSVDDDTITRIAEAMQETNVTFRRKPLRPSGVKNLITNPTDK
jgi:hypothetical protein